MFKFIEKQFRRPSGLLGRYVVKYMRRMNYPIYDSIIDSLMIQADDRIFEIGYGHGIGIDKILSQYNCHVSGIDFSKLMFKISSELNKKHLEDGKANLYLGDFLEFKISPKAYDKIICLNVVYFWDDLKTPFTKIFHALEENGSFALFMDSPDDLTRQGLKNNTIFNKYSIDEVIRELKSTGFEDITFNYNKGYYIIAK